MILVSMMKGSFERLGAEVAERQRSCGVRSKVSGLADNALVREDFGKALLSQVVVPRLRKTLVLCV